MSESIIARRKYTKINYNYVTNIIYPTSASSTLVATSLYSAPTNAVNNTLYVTAVGGSGASNETSDGAAGEMVAQEVVIEPGETIPINIGEEGSNGSNGGTTTFGTYLSAEGGLSADNIGNEEIETGSGSGYVIIDYIAEEEAEEDE